MKMVWPGDGARPSGHYTPGVISGGMLYISGQLPKDPGTGQIPEGLEAQVRQALANVESILKAAGAEKRDVVMCRLYIPDMAMWNSTDRIYAEFFGEHRPARVVVPTRELHFGALIEIEAVAELPQNCGSENTRR